MTMDMIQCTIFVKMIFVSNITRREAIFQLGVFLVMAFLFLYDRQEETFNFYQLPSYINYLIGAYTISYVLLPRFYYKGKIMHFVLFVLLVIIILIGVEELIIEQIFFPDTRGKFFHGMIYSLAEVLPLLLLLVSFKFMWDLHATQKRISDLENSVRESELKFLKTQINPHFLFNNLNNLYSYSITEPEKTSQIILELSSVLRYMLYDCQENKVPLEKELKHLEDYVNLHELQIENRGEVSIHVDNRSSGYAISPLIMVVFIENAFKHSTGSMTEDISITMDINIKEDGTLRFICENSYEEFSNTDNIVGGIGLENVKKRLSILYPNVHSLAINTNNNIYRVELTLQLNKLNP